MSSFRRVSVTLNEERSQATVRIDGQSAPIVAPVLGVEPEQSDSPSKIYLASLIHRPSDPDYAQWTMSGAVSTILTRASDGEAAQ